MTGQYILNNRGEAVPELDFIKWGKWMETADRHVADNAVKDVRVSTVFLGLDHSFGSGPVLLYETLVFGGQLDCEIWRYPTRAKAEKGHQEVLEKVRNADVAKRWFVIPWFVICEILGRYKTNKP